MKKLHELTASKTGTRWEIPQIPSNDTYKTIVDLLKEGVKFSFARYGDGEWFCIFGKQGHNCDKHTYFPDLGKRLSEIIKSEPKYMVGIQPLSISHSVFDKIKPFCEGLQINWMNADAIHNASIDGKLNLMMDALLGRYVIVVGPAHLSLFFGTGIHIVIPGLNCWIVYEDVKKQIDYHLKGIKDPVILLSCSMMAEVLLDDFHERATCIDTGSVFDPYCGVNSRSYHHAMKVCR